MKLEVLLPVTVSEKISIALAYRQTTLCVYPQRYRPCTALPPKTTIPLFGRMRRPLFRPWEGEDGTKFLEWSIRLCEKNVILVREQEGRLGIV